MKQKPLNRRTAVYDFEGDMKQKPLNRRTAVYDCSPNMKQKPLNTRTAFYDFDEGDAEPFTAKRTKFFNFFFKGKDWSKGRGKDDGSKCEDPMQRPAKSMCGGKDSMEEESTKVIMRGEELWLCDEKYSSPEFSFTADAIELKTQAFGAFKLPLLEIKAFRSGFNEKGLPGIELDLTEHGIQSLQQHLGHSDNYNICHTILSTLSDNSSCAEKIKQITSLSDGYKSIYRHGKEYVRHHTENHVNSDRKDRDNSESRGNEHVLNNCIVHRNRAALIDWCDLIYPTEDDRDAVTVTRYDYLLLEPDQFLSDTIIDFYIKYLQSQIPEADKKRFYFYNSFFFRKLTEVDKNLQTGLEKTKSSFERVKRWTAGINIFDSNYLFIPIMQNAHWSLVIVFHPGYLSAGCSDASDFKASAILHLDSLEGCHTCIEEPIRSYLMEAWRERNNHNEDPESLSTLKFVSLKVPQQTNYSDCGLFLLHYVELFIEEILDKDSTKIFPYEWFNPADVSRKRAHIQSLIQDLKANKSAGDHVRPDTYIMRSSDVPQRSVSFGRDFCDVNRTTDVLPEDNRIVQRHDYVSLDDSLECAILDVNGEDCHAHFSEANNPPDECTSKLVHGSAKSNVVEESFTFATSDCVVNSSMNANFGVAFCWHYDDKRIDRQATSVGTFSSDDMSSGQVSHECSTSNWSLAKEAGKFWEDTNAAIDGIEAGTRSVEEESKDGPIDSVGDAFVWTEGKETVTIDFKHVTTQHTHHSADDSCQEVGMCTEGAKVQPVDEVAATNTSSDGMFLQKKDGTLELSIMEGGSSNSRSRSTGCLVSKELSAGYEADISSNRGLMSRAAKGIAEGRSERSSQRRIKQCKLHSMVRRMTRSVSKGEV